MPLTVAELLTGRCTRRCTVTWVSRKQQRSSPTWQMPTAASPSASHSLPGAQFSSAHIQPYLLHSRLADLICSRGASRSLTQEQIPDLRALLDPDLSPTHCPRRFEATIGDRRVTTQTKRKSEAEAEFGTAVQQGHSAVLAKQVRAPRAPITRAPAGECLWRRGAPRRRPVLCEVPVLPVPSSAPRLIIPIT